MGTLDNCSRCGKLFVKDLKNICPACIKEVEEDYKNCVEYLRENKGANIIELSEATGVKIKQIIQFIQERRISIADFPNMAYPCEACGTPIREGRLCKKCASRLDIGIKKVLEEKENDDFVEKQNVYYNINNKIKE